jgi:tetratricopeptide (TPR) repeat protein
LYNLGITLRRVGRLDQSIEQLKKATDVQPNKAPAHNNLGLSFFENEDWDDAISSYTKAISLEMQAVNELGVSKENLSFYFNNRGLAYYHLRNFSDAIKDYDEAITLNETNAENFFNRGNVYLNQEMFEEAHADFDRAIMLEPSSAKLFHAKGLAF